MTEKLPRIGSDTRLLKAAEEELLANGGHLEMLPVAKRAGLSVGVAYHRFGSKTGLIAAVVDRFYDRLREISFGDAIPLDQDWMTRERARTAAFIDHFYDVPFAELIAGRLAREPEVQDIENAHMEALIAEGARNIAAGQRAGVIDPSLDPEIAIVMLLGGLRQAVNHAVLTKSRPDRRMLLNQVWQFIEGALSPHHQEASVQGGLKNAREV